MPRKPTTWYCSECSFKNLYVDKHCAACGYQKPKRKPRIPTMVVNRWSQANTRTGRCLECNKEIEARFEFCASCYIERRN